MEKAPNGTETSPSKLRSLPEELRNKIYKYCLIADDRHDAEFSMYFANRRCFIRVTKDLKLPPLLAINRQVREETLNLFYLSNKFRAKIKDYDASLYLAWRKHLNTFNDRIGRNDIYFRTCGTPNFENLKEWCRAVWSGVYAIKKKDNHNSPEHGIVDAAHRIAVASRDKPWEKCETQLIGLRQVLGQVDRRWLD